MSLLQISPAPSLLSTVPAEQAELVSVRPGHWGGGLRPGHAGRLWGVLEGPAQAPGRGPGGAGPGPAHGPHAGGGGEADPAAPTLPCG